MRIRRFSQILVGVCFFLMVFTSKSQSLDSLIKRYPDEKSIYLNKVQSYTISLKDGVPLVDRNELEQVEFLSQNAAAYSSAYSFYFSDFHKIKSFEAFTLLPDHKKVKVNEFKTKADLGSFVFYDDVKESTFHYPSIEPGAIGNLLVSGTELEPHLLSPFYFEENEPVLNSELRINVSKSIHLNYSLFGLDTDKIEVKIENKRSETDYTFRFKNCPPSKYFPDAPSFSWYAPHVIFYISSLTDKDGKNIPYLSNLNDLYHYQYDYLKKVNPEPDPRLKHIVDSLIFKVSSQEIKARKIYKWVQENIKYVAFENGMEGFIPRNAGLVCQRRFGDCKDMSSILTEMMKMAGIQAYFTWLGTRSLPYTFSRYPLPMVSDHMICTINLGGKYIFLDGTDPSAVFDDPPYGIQDKEVMLAINEKEYKILRIPVVDKHKNTLVDTTWMELNPEGLKGRVKKILTGYYATRFLDRELYQNKKDTVENMKNEFQRGSNRFISEKYKIQNLRDSNKVVLESEFALAGYSKNVGGDYFINLDLFKLYEHEQIDLEKRRVPVEYNFTTSRRYVTILKIPKGYKLDYIPANKQFSNSALSFSWKYTLKNDEIILTQEYQQGNLFIYPELFKSWNQVLDKIIPLYKETLSLSKI